MPAVTRTCQLTGLQLVPSEGQQVTRFANPAFGPMNPLPLAADSISKAGRYDVVGRHTIYAADSRRAGLTETLAYLSPSVGLRTTRASEVFDDQDSTDDRTTLLEKILSEQPKEFVLDWRPSRREYTLQLPVTGWFVDIEHDVTLASLNKHLGRDFAARGIRRLTRGHLTGDDRALTTAIAGWVWGQTLDDGSMPHGIFYRSKHGTNWNCYAVWLREVDVGRSPGCEPTKPVSEVKIPDPRSDPDLLAVQETLGIVL